MVIYYDFVIRKKGGMTMDNYYKINDTLYVLNSNLKVILSVSLASFSKTGDRLYPFHSEFEYKVKGVEVTSIKREASSVLIFKLTTKTAIEDSSDVCLLPQHIPLLYNTLLNCKKWFDGTIAAFISKDNKVFVANSQETQPLIIAGLSDRTISFAPIIIIDETNRPNTGLRIVLNGKVCVDIEVDRFYGLLHVMTGFNMYMATSMLLNYVNTCTPGSNKIRFDPEDEDVEDITPPSPKGRNFKKKKSFFDD